MKSACVMNWVWEVSHERQKPLPVVYKGKELDCGYRLDLVVERAVIIELESCEKVEPVQKPSC